VLPDVALRWDLAFMRLITLLNHCERFSGFVYEKARLCQESRTIEIEMRPRRGSKPVCSGTTYDHLRVRRFEFVPVWGFMVLLLYCMRRVDCETCGVRVEEVPWATGKHQLTKAYMLFLAHWARKLSWQETAASFRSSWDKVRQRPGAFRQQCRRCDRPKVTQSYSICIPCANGPRAVSAACAPIGLA
jgi:transposase